MAERKKPDRLTIHILACLLVSVMIITLIIFFTVCPQQETYFILPPPAPAPAPAATSTSKTDKAETRGNGLYLLTQWVTGKVNDVYSNTVPITQELAQALFTEFEQNATAWKVTVQDMVRVTTQIVKNHRFLSLSQKMKIRDTMQAFYDSKQS